MIRVLKITALVSVVVLLNAVTTLLFVQSAAPASAGPNCVNGDVNGDFVVDITDPIHLLGYIFEGTPVPVACAQNPNTPVAFNLLGSQYLNIPPQTPLGCNSNNPNAANCFPYFITFTQDELGSGVLDPQTNQVVINEPGIYDLLFQLDLDICDGGGPECRLSILRNGQIFSETVYDHLFIGCRRWQISTGKLAQLEQGDVLEFVWTPEYLGNSSGPTNPGDDFPRILHTAQTFFRGVKIGS